MEKLDKRMQQRVWDRVYQPPAPPLPPLSPQQRQKLGSCLQRCQMNLAVYESMTSHPVYGEAFTRMARETAEQIKMLRQMLGK